MEGSGCSFQDSIGDQEAEQSTSKAMLLSDPTVPGTGNGLSWYGWCGNGIPALEWELDWALSFLFAIFIQCLTEATEIPTLSATCPCESALPIRLRPDFLVVSKGFVGTAEQQYDRQ